MTHRPTLTTVLAAAGAAFAALAVPQAAFAQAIACGEPYRVSPGDSLSGIAFRAYDGAAGYQIIYSANRERIGPNPGVISVGMALEIPCLGETTASTADDAAIRPVATTEQLPAPDDRQIRFVTATDWAPFLNEEQEQGGMLTEVVNVAMSAAEGSPAYKIDFINDWGAHLQPLISDHAYDFSLAWFRPNCDVVERLGDGSRFRCNNLDWSEPLYEQIVGYYMRAGEPAPASHEDLMGRTICRPAGYSMFMLEEHALVEPNVTIVRGEGPEACFTGLVDGDIDVVVLATEVSNDAIANLGIADRVQLHEGISQVATLHAVIAKTHPRREEYLATLDDGIRKIKSDTRWFEIVKRHLAEHKARTN